MKKQLLCLALFIAFLYDTQTHCFGKKTVFATRSQGLNGVIELTGWQDIMYTYNIKDNYGTFAATIEYNHSFRPDRIANFLFGGENLNFSGSRAIRQTGDILSDYFGLPSDYSSTVHVSPVISNTIIDFNWFHGFDKTIPGLFIMLHAPITHTKWNLYFKEKVITPGTNFYPAGYMSNQNIPATQLPTTVTQALQGQTTFGDMQQPLHYGRIWGRQTGNRIAELQATLGWNYKKPWYHVGISARVGAPTGNATKAIYLFEEIVGNRHHWDVGGGLSAHVNLWENSEKGEKVALYFDSHISHLCASAQKRSFDFTHNGPGSRYMLLEQIESPSSELLINGTPPENQYVGTLTPAINYTTFDTKISIGVQADIVLKLMYKKNNFEFDLGYNFWGQSKEKVHERCSFPANRFALKGDAQLYGFSLANTTITIPLNATQSNATILAGQGTGNNNFQNLNTDNQPAQTTTPPTTALNQLNPADAAALNIPILLVKGSNPAILLSDSDINQESGILPRALSNKVFAYVNYIWNNGDDCDPYVGFGVSGEVANTNPECNSAASQWALWLKTGLSY